MSVGEAKGVEGEKAGPSAYKLFHYAPLANI